MEATLIILPPSCCLIYCFANAWLKKKTTFSLISMTVSQSASVTSTASQRLIIPALFTRISTLPYASNAPESTVSTAAVVDKSANTSVKLPPNASIFSFVSAQERLPTPTTFAPASASATAIPCPNPVLAPVTTATFPSSLNKSRIIHIPPS